MSDPSNGRKSDGTFAAGNTGGGRPRMPEELKEAFRAASPRAVEVLKSIMDNDDAKDSDRVRAAEVLLDRAYGKPVQQIDANVTENKPILYDPEHNSPDNGAK